MTAAKKKTPRTKAENRKRHEYEVEGGAGGAIAGAAFGGLAGPPGIAAGAVIGAAVGAIIGAVTEHESISESANDSKLDREIGVSEGELGAPNLKHPPAKVGAYSGASAGSSSHTDPQPAEGPEQLPR